MYRPYIFFPMFFRLLIQSGMLFAALLLVTTPSFASTGITVKNPWIAVAPPMMKMMAGYVTIHNPGDKPVVIHKVSSPDFSNIQMHRTVIKNGMASMIQVKNIRIVAHGNFKFSPGHYHLMMFNPKKHFKVGDSTQLTFTLASGKSDTFKFTVKTRSSADSEHH